MARLSTLLVASVLLAAFCVSLSAMPLKSHRRSEDAKDASLMDAWRQHRKAQLVEAQKVGSVTLQWNYGQNNYTISRPEGPRDFYVYVPSSYTAARAVSLIFTLHGLGDHALSFSTRVNITETAEAYGFIAVYPQGSTSILGTSWNAGTCCADQNVDDVTFLATIVQQVQSTFAIRPDSIHTFGFSNGGFMSESLGCHMSSTFTSIASISGATILEPGNAGAIAACDALYESPTSILHVHGNLDFVRSTRAQGVRSVLSKRAQVVPWDGDVLLGFPSVPVNMAGWTNRNNCTGQPVQTLNEGTFTNQVWSNCGYGNTTVQLVKNDGGSHVYPMYPKYAFDATAYLLEFWNSITPGGI